MLLVQNNVGNHFAPTLIVAPISSRFWKKVNQPTHCLIRDVGSLNNPSMVLAEQIITIDKKRVVKYIGKVPEEQIRGINNALQVSLGLYAQAACFSSEQNKQASSG